LRDDASLSNSHVEVASVNKGVVLLRGSAASLGDQYAAVADAHRVAGVDRVASEITAPGALSDDDVWVEPDRSTARMERHDAKKAAEARSERAHEEKRERMEGQEAKRETNAASPMPAATGTVRDAWITTATKTRLLADGRVPALDVNVDTRDGVVTLFGIVPDDEAKKAAEEDARQASGVKSVDNDLEVVPKSKQSSVAAKDDDVERSSTKALEGRTDLHGVDVDVKNGVARLTGTVPSQSARLSAAMVVRSVDGVRSVENDLQVQANASAGVGGGKR
jgi:hyperosmotically inducible protein